MTAQQRPGYGATPHGSDGLGGCPSTPSGIGFPDTGQPILPGDLAKGFGAGGVVGRAVADASGQELIQRLTQRMLRKKLYVILSKGGATAEQLGAILPRHLEYMIVLEKTGVLFASGPLSAAPGAPAGDGLTILRAASVEEAREIASADPFVINKLRTFEVREWTVMEGSIGVTVNLSDQSLQFA